jgi:uncharacterized coiled-coil DUF342 family protein
MAASLNSSPLISLAPPPQQTMSSAPHIDAVWNSRTISKRTAASSDQNVELGLIALPKAAMSAPHAASNNRLQGKFIKVLGGGLMGIGLLAAGGAGYGFFISNLIFGIGGSIIGCCTCAGGGCLVYKTSDLELEGNVDDLRDQGDNLEQTVVDLRDQIDKLEKQNIEISAAMKEGAQNLEKLREAYREKEKNLAEISLKLEVTTAALEKLGQLQDEYQVTAQLVNQSIQKLSGLDPRFHEEIAKADAVAKSLRERQKEAQSALEEFKADNAEFAQVLNQASEFHGQLDGIYQSLSQLEPLLKSIAEERAHLIEEIAHLKGENEKFASIMDRFVKDQAEEKVLLEEFKPQIEKLREIQELRAKNLDLQKQLADQGN